MIVFTGEKGKENKELSVLLDEESVREIVSTFKDNEKYFAIVDKHYLNKEDAEDYEVKNIEASYFPGQVQNYVKQYGGVRLQNEGNGLPNYYKECITEPHLQAIVMVLLDEESEDSIAASSTDSIVTDEDLSAIAEATKAAPKSKDEMIKDSVDNGESAEELANEPFLKQEEVNAVLKMSEVQDESTKELEDKDDGGEIVQKAPHYQNIPLKDRNGNVVELEAWEIITSILDYLHLNPKASWAMGDALKYVLRCGRKFGDEKAKTKDAKAIQDLRKVAYYINKAADWYED